jgi:hypothetical protein
MFVAFTMVALAAGGVKPQEWARDLELQVKVIEAMEGGPVVIEASVINRGPTLSYHWFAGDRCRRWICRSTCGDEQDSS